MHSSTASNDFTCLDVSVVRQQLSSQKQINTQLRDQNTQLLESLQNMRALVTTMYE